VPVIVLTARSSVVDMARALFAGCDGYLVKPASQRTLRASVRRCIRPRPTANEAEFAVGFEA
jgi:DNA-binding response OmpR family regulator